MPRILWLANSTKKKQAKKFLVEQMLAPFGVPEGWVNVVSAHDKVPSLAEYEANKMPGRMEINAVGHFIREQISQHQPTVIVTDDEATMRAILEKPYAQMTVAGSRYLFEKYSNIPLLILNDYSITRYKVDGRFIYMSHMQKLARFALGKTKPEPPFVLDICRSVEQVRMHCLRAKNAVLLSHDTETRSGFITVSGYTYDTDDGGLQTFVVPFFDPFKETGEHFAGQAEYQVRALLRDLHASEVEKITQNGMYDQAYDLKQHMPLANWLWDTAYMMHSIWAEADKDLTTISALFNDCHSYWKDDVKGVKDEGFGKTRADLERYWAYNGRDTYYTYLGGRELIRHLAQLPWAIRNYNQRIALAAGPCMAAGMRGARISVDRHAQIIGDHMVEAEKALESIRRFTATPDFNPKSSKDVGWMLYDVLSAQPTRLQKGRSKAKYGERSTDEKVLNLITEQNNVFANEFIRRLLAIKKPAGVVSNFGRLDRIARRGRFAYSLNPAGTETSRFSSGNSPFWFGRNVQNLQAKLREFIVANPDYVLLDVDYSASDDWFIAYESEDPQKIELLNSGKDVHSFHASEFFYRPYEEIVKGKKENAPWVVDAITGVRQIAKKVAHGKNFKMGPETLYNLMRREPVVTAARHLGFANPHSLSDKELIGVCSLLCDKYDHPKTGMYKRIRPWQNEVCEQAAKNGGLITNAFGFTRKFFGDPLTDDQVQRKIAAFYGQSNTAGNINRSIEDIYFHSKLDDGRSFLFLIQVHDNFVFLVHRDALHLVKPVIDIMQKPVTIHGRSFSVPVAAEVGLTWGHPMLPWRPDVTYEEIVEFERAHFAEKYKPRAHMLNSLGNFDIDLASGPRPGAITFDMKDFERVTVSDFAGVEDMGDLRNAGFILDEDY